MELLTPSLWKTFAHLRWVSLGCLMGFVVERFAYHVFDVGTLYHHSPTTFVWLLILPLIGYWFALLRSPLLSSRRCVVRVITVSLAALLLAATFCWLSLGFFAFVVFSRVQWW